MWYDMPGASPAQIHLSELFLKQLPSLLAIG
jgi:hypothetical protein